MCISLPSKKRRVEVCELLNSSLSYGIRFSNFCLPDGHEMGEPWIGPELDTENNSHLVLYEGNSSDNELNVSSHNFPNEKWVMIPTSEMIVKLCTLMPVVLIGALGNYALLYVLLKFRNLRSPANLIIANMALVDFIYLLVYPWIFLTNDFFQNYQLLEIGCKLEGGMECSLLIINVINLSAISYDRLTAIVLPRETRLTSKSAKTIICFAWIIGCVITSPLMLYRQYKERQWLDFLEIYCTEDAKVLPIYWLLLLTIMIWIPLAIMLLCYTAIFIKLDRYEQKILKREHPLCVSYKTRVAKIIFIVLLIFIVCRTPLTALLFIRHDWQKRKTNQINQIVGSSTILWYSARYIIFVNAALDPIAYGMTNEKFRKAFRLTPLVKHLFWGNKTQAPKQQPRISVIKHIGPRIPEWKCDKWLNLNDRTSSSSSFDKQNFDSSAVGSRNNLIK